MSTKTSTGLLANLRQRIRALPVEVTADTDHPASWVRALWPSTVTVYGWGDEFALYLAWLWRGEWATTHLAADEWRRATRVTRLADLEFALDDARTARSLDRLIEAEAGSRRRHADYVQIEGLVRLLPRERQAGMRTLLALAHPEALPRPGTLDGMRVWRQTHAGPAYL